MDTVLKLVIETICAAVVIYILFRENFPTMSRIEGQISAVVRSARNQMTFDKPRQRDDQDEGAIPREGAIIFGDLIGPLRSGAAGQTKGAVAEPR